MDRRTRFFWTITITLSLVFIVFEAYKLNGFKDRRVGIVRSIEETSIGTDEELERLIGDLENNLASREDFEFTLKNNPLKLQKVVYLTDSEGRLINTATANTIRVSGLYIDIDPPKASVEYKNKEYTVTVGSWIEDHKVIKITKDGILVFRRGEAKFYPLQGRTLDPNARGGAGRRSQYDYNEEDY